MSIPNDVLAAMQIDSGYTTQQLLAGIAHIDRVLKLTNKQSRIVQRGLDNPTTDIVQLLAPFQHSVFRKLRRKSNIPILKGTPLVLFQFDCECVGEGLTLGFVSNLFRCIDDPKKSGHRAYENEAWKILHTVVTKLKYIYETARRLQDISAKSILAHPELEAYKDCMSVRQENKGFRAVFTFSFHDMKCLNCTSYVCISIAALFPISFMYMIPYTVCDD